MSARLCLGFAAALLLLVTSAAAQQHPGKPIYDKWCAECHGDNGQGDGSAAMTMLPRPRDFTQARYQVRTTPSGSLPTDADIHAVLEKGMPGTAMPAWPKLNRNDRDAVVSYIKTLSRFFTTEKAPEPIRIGKAPGASEERIAEGRRIYDQLECWKCHGKEGRGDGPSAPTQEDDGGQPIRPANLSQNWRFNGGGAVEDIYMRLRTGLDGTPMPSFSDLIESGIISEDQLWSVAHFVRSLSPRKEPVPREVIRAQLRTDALPQTVDDDVWAEIESAFVPLIGQIIARPRWFAPTVHAVRVQAVHDNRELVLRLSWDDPSHSPDPNWEQWRTRITDVMEPHDASPVGGALPDGMSVQFPATAIQGRDLPYFLNGDRRTPVYLWEWRSDEGVHEALARGITAREILPFDAAAVSGSAVWKDGQWQLVLRRQLIAQDSANRITIATGTAVPIAFFAWDGSNGESGPRGSISSWYYIHLDQPVTASVFITPIVAAAITALLGIYAVKRAQKQYRLVQASAEQRVPVAAS